MPPDKKSLFGKRVWEEIGLCQGKKYPKIWEFGIIAPYGAL